MGMNGLQIFVRARLLAARRRWAILTRGDFNPYPPVPEDVFLNPSSHSAQRAADAALKLDWARIRGVKAQKEWEQQARNCLRDLLRIPGTPEPAKLIADAEMPVAKGYERRRVYLRFGPGWDAPVDIVRRVDIKHSVPQSTPVVICMQGTNAGAHLNLGEVRMPADVYKVDAGSALALQAAERGYIAVSFERACFGERRETKPGKGSASPTVDAAFHALISGETLLGQTVTELEALQRWIGSEVASDAPVYIAGYSAAGTAAIAAAAASETFAGIAVGGCVGMMRETLLGRNSTGYNDIPEVLNWFEFDALLALIAPRPCLVVAGKTDHIWPHLAGEKVMSSARRAWDQLGAAEKVELVKAQGGHTYYPELMWPAFDRMMKV